MNRRTFLGGAATRYGGFLRHARAQGTSRAPKFKIRAIRVYTGQGLTGAGETMDTVGAEDIVNANLGPSLAGRGVQWAGPCDRRSRQPLQCGWRPKGTE